MADDAIGAERLNVVRRIRCGTEIVVVATDALRGCVVVVPSDVAVGADQARVRARQGEPGRLGMVERRGRPCGCRMAQLAGKWKSARKVRGILSVIVLRSVAGNTLGRQSSVSGCMTIIALERNVRAGQYEPCDVMIEMGVRPPVHRVADIADGAEIRRLMIRIRRSPIVGQMAMDTFTRKVGKVRPRHVADRAIIDGMSPHKRKWMHAFVSGDIIRPVPCDKAMARLTIAAEIHGTVIRIARGQVVLPVAG